MTKKDYVAFAKAIKALRASSRCTYDSAADAVIKVKDVEEMCAHIFTSDNGRFDRDRFFTACGR